MHNPGNMTWACFIAKLFESVTLKTMANSINTEVKKQAHTITAHVREYCTEWYFQYHFEWVNKTQLLLELYEGGVGKCFY